VSFSRSRPPSYNVPKKYKGKFPKGYSEVIESIGYADFSLVAFSKPPQKCRGLRIHCLSWLPTIPLGNTKKQSKNTKIRWESFAIPFVVYKADGSFTGVDSSVVQQVDIMPTILEYTGYNKPFTSFGKSITDNPNTRYSLQYINRLYQIQRPQLYSNIRRRANPRIIRL
jgi:arylsulfatase A-like enzyme